MYGIPVFLAVEVSVAGQIQTSKVPLAGRGRLPPGEPMCKISRNHRAADIVDGSEHTPPPIDATPATATLIERR
jgi:hypothetical protein